VVRLPISLKRNLFRLKQAALILCYPIQWAETCSAERDEMKAMKERLLRKGERGFAVRGAGYFPVLVKLHDGSLAAVVRSGAPHIGVGGRLDFLRSLDGGKTWSSPQTIVYMPPDTRNPAFGQAPDGKLILAFALTGPYPKGKWQPPISARYSVWLTLSEDNGQTWLPPRPLKVSPLTYGSPYGKIVSLPDGTLLLPLYHGTKVGVTKVTSCVQGTVAGVGMSQL
jgi:hypothetical protein